MKEEEAKGTSYSYMDMLASPPPATPPPQLGVRVIRGNARETEEMECVRDPTQTTAGEGSWNTIAAQCCESDGTCRRYVGDKNDGCVAGHSSREGVVPTTYAQAVTMCADHGLQLCEKSCRNEGCWYNRHPVWTALPCEADIKDELVSPPPPPSDKSASDKSEESKESKAVTTATGAYGAKEVAIVGAVAFVPTLGLAVAGYMYRRRSFRGHRQEQPTAEVEVGRENGPEVNPPNGLMSEAV